MSFEKKTWEDRVSQYPNRRKIIDVDSGVESTVDVERAEGEIANAGTALSAESFNDLEERVFAAIEEVIANFGGLYFAGAFTLAEYNALSTHPSNAVYFIKG